MDSDDQQINGGILIFNQTVCASALGSFCFCPLDHSGSPSTGPEGTCGGGGGGGGNLLDISEMNENQNQMTQQPGPVISRGFE